MSAPRDTEQLENLLGNGELKQDLESNVESSQGNVDNRDYEYTVGARYKLVLLAVYLGLNMTLTLHSKAILQQIPCPWLLTTLHTTFSSIGCSLVFFGTRSTLTRLSSRDVTTLVAFSFLFTINIAISVVSLSLVSVPFHQTARALIPASTIAAYAILYKRSYSTWTQLSILPIVFGVALATYGDISFTVLGLTTTLLGVVLATCKTIATNRILTGRLSLPPLEVLMWMSPLAAAQSCIYAGMVGEIGQLQQLIADNKLTRGLIFTLFCNGCLALVLNITSFQSNKSAGALTLTVCGNVKQILTILLGIVLFNVHINWVNGLGLAIAASGAALFSWVELRAKEASKS
ncbi:triose-phosphate transporter family-domain-containing protein [Elsinoe ampelina]|uniref:Triose-phosphate transporter family-domain-containing protein n=1 Tax=Elsinoe ampelina TaxID=302913 RepID=A0A6A6GE07_9PEZI|nr:triose-phosphate transporter family-domain-containing protein [Elsinoe ampelina]